MLYKAGSTLPGTLRNPSRLRRRYGWIAATVVATSLLLTAQLADGLPAGGNGNDKHGFKVVDKNGNLVGYTVTGNMVALPTGGPLLFVDALTGRPKRAFNPGRGVTAPPDFVGGTVYVVSNMGVLYALHLEQVGW